MPLDLELPWLRLITMKGNCLCTIGWPRHLLPSFPKRDCRVDTLRLFLDKWYHIACESWGQVHASYWAWLMELWMDDDYLCMIMVFVNVFLLIMVIWFCVNFFYNKLTIAIFVLCGWYLWWSRTFIRGSRWTIVEYTKWDSFVELLSQRDDVGIILGESPVLLINSSVPGSILFFN